MDYLIAYITAKDAEEARKMGEIVVKQKLAACANIIQPVESIYWWKGRIEKGKEAVLLLKTKSSLADRLVSAVKELHSYDVPCIDLIAVADGNHDYFKWLEEVTE
jgi:periplasmic divalent cation tolerance protein